MELFPLNSRRKTTVRVIPRFPARVAEGAGVNVARANGTFTFGLDYNSLIAIGGAEVTDKLALQRADGSFASITTEDLLTWPLGVSVRDYGAVGDDSTDNWDAFRAAFESGNAEIYVPAGTYRIAFSGSYNWGLPIGSAVKRIYGPGLLKLVGADPADYRPLLAPDGCDGLIIERLQFEIDKASYATISCIATNACSNVQVRNCAALKCGFQAIGFYDSSDCSAEYNHFEETANGHINASLGSTRISVRNNYLVGNTGMAYASVAFVGGEGHQARGNRIVSPQVFGVYFEDCNSWACTDNIILDSVLEAISTNSTTQDIEDGVIADNLLIFDSASTDFGISVFQAGSFAAERCSVVNNKIYNPGKAGIACYAKFNNGLVQGNEINDCNQDSTSPSYFGDGVYVKGQHNVVAFNVARSSDGKMYDGCAEDSGSDYNTFKGNTSIGHSNSAVAISGSNSRKDAPTLVMDQTTYDGLTPDPETLYFITA